MATTFYFLRDLASIKKIINIRLT